jgi:hypothetical protein
VFNPKGARIMKIPFYVSTLDKTADFEVDNEGNIFFLRPLTSAAQGWIDANLADDYLSFGDTVVVEHRYISDIASGILRAGLQVR